MKKLLIVAISLLSILVFHTEKSHSASYWSKTYSGDYEDIVRSVQQTSDGGFIAAANTRSFGVLSQDLWVIKLNENGTVSWQKTYGGSGYSHAYSIQQTSDGGYVVAGYTNSSGAGSFDFWVLKLDENGDISWQKIYGGSNGDSAKSIQQTSDGGYIVTGNTTSFGAGNYDLWVLKLDGNGNVSWQKYLRYT